MPDFTISLRTPGEMTPYSPVVGKAKTQAVEVYIAPTSMPRATQTAQTAVELVFQLCNELAGYSAYCKEQSHSYVQKVAEETGFIKEADDEILLDDYETAYDDILAEDEEIEGVSTDRVVIEEVNDDYQSGSYFSGEIVKTNSYFNKKIVSV